MDVHLHQPDGLQIFIKQIDQPVAQNRGHDCLYTYSAAWNGRSGHETAPWVGLGFDAVDLSGGWDMAITVEQHQKILGIFIVDAMRGVNVVRADINFEDLLQS